MSKKFTVSKAGFDDASVLVSDGTNQTAFFIKEGVSTLEEFMSAMDISSWDENHLEIFGGGFFANAEGIELGTFEVPYIEVT